MSLQTLIMDEIKTAMKAKDTVSLEALRAIKSEMLLAATASGSKEELTEDDEIKLLQRLVKTRKESARIFTEQNRPDLAEPELAQVAVIEKFLPAQLSEEEIEAVKEKVIYPYTNGISPLTLMNEKYLKVRRLLCLSIKQMLCATSNPRTTRRVYDTQSLASVIRHIPAPLTLKVKFMTICSRRWVRKEWPLLP